MSNILAAVARLWAEINRPFFRMSATSCLSRMHQDGARHAVGCQVEAGRCPGTGHGELGTGQARRDRDLCVGTARGRCQGPVCAV